jgi:MYXO-CTERM domain-containing protein
MKKIFALIATMLLSFPLAFAQPPQGASGGDATTTNQQTDNGTRHDYGWVGLLGLVGLAGLAGRRRSTVNQDRDRGATDIRRAA